MSTLQEWAKNNHILVDGKLVKASSQVTKGKVNKLPPLNAKIKGVVKSEVDGETGAKIFIKPLSVNEAWRGKRYKSKKYIKYSEALTFLLPNNITIPDGLLVVHYEYGLSSMGGDWDNPIKPSQDLIASKYGINDNRIRRGIVDLVLVKKGDEYLKFNITKL